MTEREHEAGGTVRLGNLFTKIDNCQMDRKLEGHGLLDKFVQLTPAEALDREARRECEGSGNTSVLEISVDNDGYCSANCRTTSCEFNPNY